MLRTFFHCHELEIRYRFAKALNLWNFVDKSYDSCKVILKVTIWLAHVKCLNISALHEKFSSRQTTGYAINVSNATQPAWHHKPTGMIHIFTRISHTQTHYRGKYIICFIHILTIYKVRNIWVKVLVGNIGKTST